MPEGPRASDLPRFGRRFFGADQSFTAIGGGALGGKAAGLLLARDALADRPDALRLPGLALEVPTLSVLATDAFDAFVSQNRLGEVLAEPPDDHRLAHAFQRGDLPPALLGDLFELMRQVRTPLAVRSSSLLEDALTHPFAGVYATKMIPNNQLDVETRFRKLTEAIKFVYASTFFESARRYRDAIGQRASEEKMAVVLQEVVGRRHGTRFYPDVSGVARSLGFYPFGPARPEDGAASLALGLGKTIVDGGVSWTLSPRYPRVAPPFASPRELLDSTQTRFWAVNMGDPPAYDPIAETEYLVRGSLEDAEADGVLSPLVSTWDVRSDRLVPGTGPAGPRALDFAPLRLYEEPPLSAAVAGLLRLFAERLKEPVEIEFALTLERGRSRLGFLQVRPMGLAAGDAPLSAEDLAAEGVLVASERATGHGSFAGLRDVVFLDPAAFDRARSRAIAGEVAALNGRLLAAGRPYLLIGFGRWGSADPWLGVPVDWSQVSGARAIVEAGLPGLGVEMSQGAHFFHNLLAFQVAYLSVPEAGPGRIDWSWLLSLPPEASQGCVRHVVAPEPLLVRVDARSGRGIVRRGGRDD